MNPTRKVLKLSSKGPTQNGQKVEKKANILDDSLDDFIITRPLRTERKSAKNSSVTKKLDSSDRTIDSKQVGESSVVKETETVKNNNKSAVQSNSKNNSISAPVVCHQCPLCTRTFNNLEQKERHVSKCAQSQNVDPKTLSAAEEMQERQMAERLSLGLPPVAPALNKTKSSRRRAIDPSSADLSLAIALSESLQSAAESERRKEEEMLLAENLVEVISDLRQEDGESGRLAHIFQRPADVLAAGPSVVTRIKRKPKPRSKKDQNKDYILAIRSHAERERLIAQRAAAILSEEANNEPLKTLPKKSKYFQYVSEFVSHHKRKDIPLWKYSSLPIEGTGDEIFYVGALRNVLSPSKKKAGYTNILLHVSQLPGRNSSQVDPGITLSSTQAVLEELALGADGGFLDEEQVPPVPTSDVNRLADDWSHFVDNPHMSDFAVQTSSRVIRAHRLVLAARCPNIIKEAATELNWTQFSASAAERVIRFIYTGRYEHGDGRDAENVYRIARRYCINELIDLLPCHYGSSFLDEEEEEQIEEEKKSTENSIVIDVDQEEVEHIKNLQSCSMTMEQIVENLADSQFVEESHSLHADEQQVDMKSKCSFSPERTARTPIDMEISLKVSHVARPPPEPQPMSPDMFALSDDDDSVIDLTQEEEDKHSHQLPPQSQFAGSCEGSFVNSDSDSFDGDVSMANGSKVDCPTRSLSPINDSNALRQRYEDFGGGIDSISPQNEVISEKSVSPAKSPDRPTSPLASTSNVNNSFFGNQSWNDYDYGGMNQHYPSSPRSEPEQDPIYSSQSKLTTKVAAAASTSFRQPDADRPPDALDYDDFPDELNSLFQHDFSGHMAEPFNVCAAAAEMSTPEAPARPAKKRKIEVTPLPDYQTMNTPGLRKELDKYGLKPLKRKNAVKLLHHIYEELHPFVTDSESSFSETPQRSGKSQHNKSPIKSPVCSSSSMQSESSEEDEMEEIAELDRQHAGTVFVSSQPSQNSSLSLNEQLKNFLAAHQEIHKMVLTYDPIPFNYLYKEVRKAGIKCKAADLLDWCDQQCIACRMNKKNNKDGIRSPGKSPKKSPNKASRRVAKKLIS